MLSCPDFDLALCVYVVAQPHIRKLLDVGGHALLEDMLMHNARDTWVSEDVGIARHYSVLWERPMLLRAACTAAGTIHD